MLLKILINSILILSANTYLPTISGKFIHLQEIVAFWEKFYEKTKEDKDRWSHLFNHVGLSLKNSGNQLEASLKQRTIDFFEWRFEKKEPSELKEFTFWMGAECLDAEWRLTSLSKILDISELKDIKIYMQIDVLREMIEDHTTLVIECFAKLTDFAVKNDKSLYIRINEAKPILPSRTEQRP